MCLRWHLLLCLRNWDNEGEEKNLFFYLSKQNFNEGAFYHTLNSLSWVEIKTICSETSIFSNSTPPQNPWVIIHCSFINIFTISPNSIFELGSKKGFTNTDTSGKWGKHVYIFCIVLWGFEDQNSTFCLCDHYTFSIERMLCEN